MLTEVETINIQRVHRAALHFSQQDMRIGIEASLLSSARDLYDYDNKPQRDCLANALRSLAGDLMLRLPDCSTWPPHLAPPTL